MPKTKIYLISVSFGQEIVAKNEKEAQELFWEYLDSYKGDIIADTLEIKEK